jgi:D-alanyl-D-alanine carboxypeptidase
MRRHWTASVVIALAVAVAWSGSVAAAADDPRAPGPSALARIANDVRRATDAPGAIVAVQVGNRAPVIVARGSRERSGEAPIAADDPFVVASVSKAFTAALVLELVRRRRLALDDPVARYVPGWDRRITVRRLLDHSSGLPSWGNKDDPPDSPRDELENRDLRRRFTMAESLEPVRVMPLLARPGTKTHYSNANTILAGLVVEAVTGTSLAAAYHRYVLDPLRLRSTGYSPQETPPRAPISGVLSVGEPPVELATSQYPQDSYLTLAGPSAAMVSDAPDLLRLAQATLRGSFPTRRLADRARVISAGGAGLGIIGFGPRGYCIFDGCPPGVRFRRIGFAGNGPGVAVRVVYDPARDVTVLVFANSSRQGKLDPFAIRLFELAA